MTEKTINHFMFLKLSDTFWESHPGGRTEFFPALAEDFHEASSCSNFYQVSPLHAEADLLVWNAVPVENEKDEAHFFDCLGKAVNARRPLIQPVVNFWGYTRPSLYSRSASSQEIDPFAALRQTYLVLYPFVKTIQWYLLSKDTRQGMMNEHIRVGHQYPEIKQLLLYSFGVQDQEFVVVYETDDLPRFSDLVAELRGADGRSYTLRDTPLHTAINHPAEETLALWK